MEHTRWPSKAQRIADRLDRDQPPIERTSPSIWDAVVEDMKGRDQFGQGKYGKALQANDGRDTLKDAYEEALDLAVYLKKAMIERDSK